MSAVDLEVKVLPLKEKGNRTLVSVEIKSSDDRQILSVTLEHAKKILRELQGVQQRGGIVVWLLMANISIDSLECIYDIFTAINQYTDLEKLELYSVGIGAVSFSDPSPYTDSADFRPKKALGEVRKTFAKRNLKYVFLHRTFRIMGEFNVDTFDAILQGTNARIDQEYRKTFISDMLMGNGEMHVFTKFIINIDPESEIILTNVKFEGDAEFLGPLSTAINNTNASIVYDEDTVRNSPILMKKLKNVQGHSTIFGNYQ